MAFICYSQTSDDVHENLEGYNSVKKVKVSIIFDGMIADIVSNLIKKLKPIVTEFLLRGGKLTISFLFISGSYFTVRSDVINCFIMKIPKNGNSKK